MTSPRRLAWSAFTFASTVLLLVLTWLTATMTQLDHDELTARRLSSMHERLRLSLWRMDSFLAPLVAREAGRPAGDYRPFPSATTAWTRGFSKLGPGEVLVPSPLLATALPLFSLHFELGPEGLTSPQVPTGNARDACEANGIDGAKIEQAAQKLAELTVLLTPARLEPALGGAETLLFACGKNPVSPSDPLPTQQSVQEYSNRQRSVQGNSFNPQVLDLPAGLGLVAGSDAPGPLVPVWLDAVGGSQLLFVRRVGTGATGRIQGVVVDWPALQTRLTSLIEDLFPAGSTRLVRCEHPTAAEQPSMLASVPTRLEAPYDDSLCSSMPMPWILGTTWGVTLLGLVGLAFALRAAIEFGERRARFAAAVTHELRTPLTTFRMYSEMLAEGVVTEPAAQKEYLTTLQRESDRLSRVVENVLAWSRLEDGRFTARRVPCEVGPMLDRLVPTLQRRLAEADLQLVVDATDEARAVVTTTDEDAVGQILFNLVDNAAKYARGAGDGRVELTARTSGGRVQLALRDHGQGVQRDMHDRIFAPFDRGAVAAGSNDVPGVGLGLALARGLAHDLDGDLRLDATVADGACFVLELPLA